MISQAPISFSIAVLSSSALIFLLFRYWYKERLAAAISLKDFYKEKFENSSKMNEKTPNILKKDEPVLSPEHFIKRGGFYRKDGIEYCYKCYHNNDSPTPLKHNTNGSIECGHCGTPYSEFS